MNSSLSKSYKGGFPFRLGTTSFIFRDTYASNVENLGPFLDEIELVLFESAPDSLPTAVEIQTLRQLSIDHDISYNIHLPIDIKLGSSDRSERWHAVESVRRVSELAADLQPSTFTLHLELDEDPSDIEKVLVWQEHTYNSLDRILATGLPAHMISVENLMYPVEIVEEILREMDLRICFDVGHLFLMGEDLSTTFLRNQEITDIIHFYAIGQDGEHNSLERLPEQPAMEMIRLMGQFSGTVSLEVFSYEDLVTSLNHFEKIWHRWGHRPSEDG